MRDESGTATAASGARRVRWRRRGPFLAAVVPVLALALASCGGGSSGPGVARAGTPTTSGSSSGTGSGRASPLAFSRCMRAHGITDFPDPNTSGQLFIQGSGSGNGGDLNPRSAQFQAAQNACKALAPGGGRFKNSAQARGNELKFARCMRRHGLTDFPDPNGRGGLELRPGGDLDPNSPQFQSAQRACLHYLGGPGGRLPTVKVGGPPTGGPTGGASS